MAENKETRERVRALVKQVLENVPMEEEKPEETFPKRVVVNSLQDKIDKEFDRDESAKNLYHRRRSARTRMRARKFELRKT